MFEILADALWILLLCTFSIMFPFRLQSGWKRSVLILTLFLVLLAAVHSHPLWSSSRLPKSAKPSPHKFTRVFTMPAVLIDTGLRLDDAVERMAFDRHGHLWLTTPEGGPYIYSIETNELTNLLRPDYVYGLHPEDNGMWLLTSYGAILQDDLELKKTVSFPPGVVPLCAQKFGTANEKVLYFGTTRGLYVLARGKNAVEFVGLEEERIVHLLDNERALLLTTTGGIWRYNLKNFIQEAMPQKRISGLSLANHRLYANTDSALYVYGGSWKSIEFAKKELTNLVPNSTTTDSTSIFFGTAEGSVLAHKQGAWRRFKIGSMPVSGLAANEKGVYAWINGQLFAVQI